MVGAPVVEVVPGPVPVVVSCLATSGSMIAVVVASVAIAVVDEGGGDLGRVDVLQRRRGPERPSRGQG
ncbi:hypothetical protein [Nannocystis punicea]|uniref:Uncharacterized protein n=1 Tax=Nannocystis punicea TaxID=2995304 RepID=A0ABY7H341_9BACT|nr:hypothetical protein [Nannocystis poenicansa]WAS93573.1 hypothetical protein O0S08_46160 [Nannocystis poenicansa]